MSPGKHAAVLAFALSSLMLPASRSIALEAACVPGHNTVILPCTFDNGVVSIDSATGPNGTELTSGAHHGHHTRITFPTDQTFGPGIQIAADIARGANPFSATDDGTTTSSGSITLTLSTVGGGFLIDAFKISFINPVVTGTGSFSWTFGPLAGDQNTTGGQFDVGPASSVTETVAGTLSQGAAGTATVDGLNIFVRLVAVPEPGTGLLLIVGLLGLASWRRTRA